MPCERTPFHYKITFQSKKTKFKSPSGKHPLPIIFTIDCENLEEWIKHSKLVKYANDRSTSHSGHELGLVLENLGEDVSNILKFKVSNRLVANPSKKEFLI